jgi:hypothetical protein
MKRIIASAFVFAIVAISQPEHAARGRLALSHGGSRSTYPVTQQALGNSN